jgi:hypothetical protein
VSRGPLLPTMVLRRHLHSVSIYACTCARERNRGEGEIRSEDGNDGRHSQRRPRAGAPYGALLNASVAGRIRVCVVCGVWCLGGGGIRGELGERTERKAVGRASRLARNADRSV